ncbi:MAG: GDSL-type esterase/lipase family protein [bacterium]|nr:GDSL-type esterase/lipase family protein [bacterium]
MGISLEEIWKYLKEKNNFRIVFLGDSITSTEWVHPNWREIVEYVLKDQLEEKMADWKTSSWGIRAINSGFDGATCKDLIEKLDSDVFSYNPALVIAIIGKNDMHLHTSPEIHREEVKELIGKLSEKVPFVVYGSSTPTLKEEVNERYAQYVEQVKTLFPFKNVQFVNLFEKCKQFDLSKLFTFVSTGEEVLELKPGEIDCYHPNQLGNAYIAKVILKEVFDIDFDPERYMKDTLAGEMYPGY